MIKVIATVLALMSSTAQAASPMNCTSTSKLQVDADGAPDSYRVDGNGLSYTCDGVFALVGGVAQTHKNNPAGWQALCRRSWATAVRSGDYSKVKVVGFLMRSGKPVIQGAGDPLPGQAYVTTTSLSIPGTPDDSQRHFVNAREIPYVVISPAYARQHRLRPGDLLAVYRPQTAALAFAVYGDCCSMGEGSIRLHQDLGNDPLITKTDGTVRAKRGIGDRVWFVALTGARTRPTIDAAAWRAQVNAEGTKTLREMGGLAALRQCIARTGR